MLCALLGLMCADVPPLPVASWSSSYVERVVDHAPLGKAYANGVAIAEARQIVTAAGKDPASITFRNVFQGRAGAVCGEAQGKNSFGALTGYSPFVVFVTRQFATNAEAAGHWGNYCR